MVLMVGIILAVLFLSFANGANDNFKGVATLYGSRQLSYKQAIGVATATTFAGSICALFLSQGLIRAFSGKGLVPDAVVANPAFMISVSLGAAMTVFVAARMGMPISTTHALAGGLVGAGLVLSPSGVNIAPLAGVFVVPLLVSPLLAALLCSAGYPILSFLRKRAGLTESTCVCVGEKTIPVQISASGEMTAAATTATLVILASRWGVPVSTTHVSCGSLFGLGAVSRKARWEMIRTIVGAWISTLPVAAAIAAVSALILTAAPSLTFATEPAAPRSGDVQPRGASIHSHWADILQKYVSQNGLVAYSSWKKNDTDVRKLETYLQALSHVRTDSLARPEAIAHYLNLYNASMVKLVLDHYPIPSVKKIGGFGGPWKMKVVQAQDRLISLDDIEHGTLRKKYKDPRVHFALVCASISCPPIRAEAYEGKRLDTQLADQERTFMTDTGRNRWRIVTSGLLSKEDLLEMGLSSIFKWFGEDFGGEEGVVRRIRPFLDPAARSLLDESRYDVDYLDYDWSLNERKVP